VFNSPALSKHRLFPMKIWPGVSTALAVRRVVETRLKVGQPEVIRDWRWR